MTFEHVTEDDLLALARTNLVSQFDKHFPVPRTVSAIPVASERPASVLPAHAIPGAGAGCSSSQPETKE
jgi:hypothetical protein